MLLLVIGIFIALSIFYYINQKTNTQREDRRDHLKQLREDYLNSLLRIKKEKEEKINGDEV